MTIFTVKEIIVDTYRRGGEGIYSSLLEAQKAILDRVADTYSKKEMEKFEFSFDGYEYDALGNDYTPPCVYYIEEVELNAPIA